MRIKSFSIKNFRSIESIMDFKIIDSKVTTFIGGNGSGKSNILRALASLKDTRLLSDTDYHAKDEPDKEIRVSAEFTFSDEDTELLEKVGLNISFIRGLIVTLVKPRGQNHKFNFEPLGLTQEFGIDRNTAINLLQDANQALKNLTLVDPDAAKRKQELENILSVPTSSITAEGLKTVIDTAKPLMASLASLAPEPIAKLEQANEIVSYNLGAALQRLFDEVGIEFFSLDNYLIEEEAPLSELKNGETHPFLFDMLTLSGKSADDIEQARKSVKISLLSAANRQLTSELLRVWTTHALEFLIDKDGEQLVTFNFRSPQGHPVGLNSLSEGEKWFLRFYTRLAIAERSAKQVIWLFDEPGRDLHAKSQIDLKAFFERISGHSQVIYTTHQPMMMPWHRLERIFVVENTNQVDNEKGTVIHKRFWKDEELKSPLREALALFVGEELLTGKEHLIIEGISDYFYLQGWLRFFQRKNSSTKIWTEQFSESTRSLTPVSGINKIPLFLLFIGRETGNQVNWVVLVDTGKKLEELNKQIGSSGLAKWAHKVTHLGALIGVNNVENAEAQNVDIEDLFTKDEFFHDFIEYYSVSYPNVALPSLDEFREETINRRAVEGIELLLQKQNPDIKINGKDITLDKPGVAQHVYYKLANGTSKYSEETGRKFRAVLKETDNLFKKVPQQEADQ